MVSSILSRTARSVQTLAPNDNSSAGWQRVSRLHFWPTLSMSHMYIQIHKQLIGNMNCKIRNRHYVITSPVFYGSKIYFVKVSSKLLIFPPQEFQWPPLKRLLGAPLPERHFRLNFPPEAWKTLLWNEMLRCDSALVSHPQQSTVTSCTLSIPNTCQHSGNQKQPVRDFGEFCTWSLFGLNTMTTHYTPLTTWR